MGLSKLNYLYKTLVLEHAARPHHHGTLADASGQVTLHNPTCGDTLNVTARLANGKITDINFTGSGCTISQSSASMMGDVLIGRSITEAHEMIKNFSTLAMGGTVDEKSQEQLKDAAVLGSVAQFPTRIKCATLAWHAMEELLDENES